MEKQPAPHLLVDLVVLDVGFDFGDLDGLRLPTGPRAHAARRQATEPVPEPQVRRDDFRGVLD